MRTSAIIVGWPCWARRRRRFCFRAGRWWVRRITINGTEFKIVGSVEKISRGNQDFDDQKVYIPVTTMLQLYPLKGDNIAKDALTSIQYQPTKPGMRRRRLRPCIGLSPRGTVSIHSMKDALSGVGHHQGDEDGRAQFSTRWIFFWAVWES